MKSRAGWFATLLLPVCAAHAQASLDCNTAKLADPANATYIVEGDAIPLVHGAHSQAAAPGAHTTHETHLIPGAQACGNFDGEPVVVTLLSDDPGGSGTYIYVAALPRSGHSYPAALVGDRIVPKSVVVDKGQIVVTYLGRSNDAPMAAPPTQKLVRRFGLQHGHLVDQP